MNEEEIQRVAESVGERHGWDFSRMQTLRDPIPWDYPELVKTYMYPPCHVLDIGTGGGEMFLSLANSVTTGVGIDTDPQMITAAQANSAFKQVANISWEVMGAEALQFPESAFDVILNRHAYVHVEEIVRVLRPGGLFITQQVGDHNTANICEVFGCEPSGHYGKKAKQEIQALTEKFQLLGCTLETQQEYDVDYWFSDTESFIFWLKAIPIPEDFAVEKHWKEVDQIIQKLGTAKGIKTNEHRILLVARKYGLDD